MTSIIGAAPSTPSNGNSTAWEQDCVLTRLLSTKSSRCSKGSGGHVKHVSPVLEMDSREEPDPKHRKVIGRLRRKVK